MIVPTLALILLLNAATTHAADPIPLRAGPLTMVFEPDNAFLRYLNIGPHEVLLGINAPIRNDLWGTVKPVVTNIKHEAHDDHFKLTFDALCKERDIDFLWKGTLTGTAEGKVEFNFEGTARSTFKRNRIGFCVLHAASAGGKPWIIEKVDGKKSKGGFPEFIAPHQPAQEIREVAHELASGLWAHVRMEGDTFEMEDQRNWTDASFKTYCTPLEIPYPVLLEKGTTVSQKISIWVEGDVNKYSTGEKGSTDGVTLTLNKHQQPLPRLGLQVSSEMDTLSKTELTRLKKLRLDHLRVELTPAENTFASKLREATKQAKALGVVLHVALRLGDNAAAELKQLSQAAEKLHPPVAMWFIMGTDEAGLQQAREILFSTSNGAYFGAPRDGISFTELNRERPSEQMMEVVAYNVTPQIHASDNASIVETLPIQGDTVRSTRQFIGQAPLVISPITFRTALPGNEPLPGELPWYVDARQPSLFAASWTVGSIKFLAEAGVHAATYYETLGWQGIMDSKNPPTRPDKFPSTSGQVFPIYHVLRDFSDFAGGRVQGLDSSDNLSVVALALRKDNRVRLLIANLKDHPQSVSIKGIKVSSVSVRSLDADSLNSAGDDPEKFSRRTGKDQSADQAIELAPHAIVRVDYADG
jgi:hypothetical protein